MNMDFITLCLTAQSKIFGKIEVERAGIIALLLILESGYSFSLKYYVGGMPF